MIKLTVSLTSFDLDFQIEFRSIFQTPIYCKTGDKVCFKSLLNLFAKQLGILKFDFQKMLSDLCFIIASNHLPYMLHLCDFIDLQYSYDSYWSHDSDNVTNLMKKFVGFFKKYFVWNFWIHYMKWSLKLWLGLYSKP